MKRPLSTLLGFVLAVAVAAPARAAGPDAPIDLDQALDNVVMLAAKRPQPLREAAASTSVITAADLAAYGWRDFTEAIQSLAGFYGSYSGDNTYIGVRGTSIKGDYNGRILILIDGHLQQEWWSHSAYPDQMGLDATMIDHIEVLRGPASALYGSLGFLAIVNVVTRRGSDQNWASGNLQLQDGDSYRATVNIGHRWKNGLEFGLSATGMYSLGKSYTYPELTNNQSCVPAFPSSCKNGKTDRESDRGANAAFYAHLNYKGFQLKASYSFLDKAIPIAPYRSLFNDHATRYLTDRGYLDLAYEIGDPRKVQATVRGTFDYGGYADDLANAPDPDHTTRWIFKDRVKSYWVGTEVKFLLEREWLRKVFFAFTGGGEFAWFHVNQESGEKGATTTTTRPELLLGAVYAQAELSYLRKVFFTLGVRGDFASELVSYNFSPRAGLVVLPYPTGTFKLLYSRGFIRPSWYAAFFDDGTSIVANPKLRPERADNYELVFQQELAKNVTLTASTFYIRAQDLIQSGTTCVTATTEDLPTTECPAGQAARTQRQNLAAFQSIGAELGVSGRVWRNLRFYTNYSFAHVTTNSGTRPFNSPEHLWKLGLSIPIWREVIWLGSEVQVISPRRYSPDATAESGTQGYLSAFIQWRGLPKGFSASFKAYNIVGKTYYDPSQAEDSYPITKIPRPGPSFLLRLTYER